CAKAVNMSKGLSIMENDRRLAEKRHPGESNVRISQETPHSLAAGNHPRDPAWRRCSPVLVQPRFSCGFCRSGSLQPRRHSTDGSRQDAESNLARPISRSAHQMGTIAEANLA